MKTTEEDFQISSGTPVEVYLKNNCTIQGFIESWNDILGVLRAPGGHNRMIIYKPIENVLMMKIIELIPERVKLPMIEPLTTEDFPPTQGANKTEQVTQHHLNRIKKEKTKITALLSKNRPASSTHRFLDQSPPSVEVPYYESPNFKKH